MRNLKSCHVNGKCKCKCQCKQKKHKMISIIDHKYVNVFVKRNCKDKTLSNTQKI